MSNRRWCGAACLGVMLVCLTGCQGNQPPLAKVTGHVTYNGLPARAEVVFQPEGPDHQSAGRPSLAVTNDRGEFVLQYAEHQPGAVVGPHRVTITLYPNSNTQDFEYYHEQFRIEKTVRLERLVQAHRTNRFRFVLN
ncbi:MAG TPA: hypothetical protein VHB77_07485 [Planctomycetaceae bacterium]|nr:hypothetical protein [Planctomycetaceae bacterium]